MADKFTLTFTKGESLFITESLKQLRSEIRQAIKEHGDDDDGGYDAHIRILDKIILKFSTALIQHTYN